MERNRTRLLSGLLLLALFPVVAFLLDRSVIVIVLSAVCVVLVAGSLYAMFGPSDEHAATGTN